MNPIEHIWSLLKYRVHKRLGGGEHTQQALENAIQIEWDALEQHEIDRIISTMPQPVEDLLLAQGGANAVVIA